VGACAAELPITLSCKLLPEMEREEAELLKQFHGTVPGDEPMQQYQALQVTKPSPTPGGLLTPARLSRRRKLAQQPCTRLASSWRMHVDARMHARRMRRKGWGRLSPSKTTSALVPHGLDSRSTATAEQHQHTEDAHSATASQRRHWRRGTERAVEQKRVEQYNKTLDSAESLLQSSRKMVIKRQRLAAPSAAAAPAAAADLEKRLLYAQYTGVGW
jgi:hypothetical protein